MWITAFAIIHIFIHFKAKKKEKKAPKRGKLWTKAGISQYFFINCG